MVARSSAKHQACSLLEQDSKSPHHSMVCHIDVHSAQKHVKFAHVQHQTILFRVPSSIGRCANSSVNPGRFSTSRARLGGVGCSFQFASPCREAVERGSGPAGDQVPVLLFRQVKVTALSHIFGHVKLGFKHSDFVFHVGWDCERVSAAKVWNRLL